VCHVEQSRATRGKVTFDPYLRLGHSRDPLGCGLVSYQDRRRSDGTRNTGPEARGLRLDLLPTNLRHSVVTVGVHPCILSSPDKPSPNIGSIVPVAGYVTSSSRDPNCCPNSISPCFPIWYKGIGHRNARIESKSVLILIATVPIHNLCHRLIYSTRYILMCATACFPRSLIVRPV
jgi:hypothetical protein